MAELKWWAKRFWCWLTGGHTYADINLRTERFPEHRVTCFCNKCLKCGKWDVFAVDDKALYYDGFPLYEQFGRADNESR
jgi:hypothetical protein